MSAGSRSAVPCTRWKEPPRLRAKARARVVFPLPGTSSMSTWPPESSAHATSCTAVSRPRTTRRTLSTTPLAQAGGRARHAFGCGTVGAVTVEPGTVRHGSGGAVGSGPGAVGAHGGRRARGQDRSFRRRRVLDPSDCEVPALIGPTMAIGESRTNWLRLRLWTGERHSSSHAELPSARHGLSEHASADPAASAAPAASQRDWQARHQNRLRPAISSVATGVPHTRQGSPVRR